ncbi:hypothetical protein MSAN_01207700 [Mycena sanguinolenta]|uniref:F-box domain-containing protein n=1 Tax=Mycena sanguinolenta TaxID=230812 RepID=A0A8H6YHJ5_9AGAR|nr:hypothetical protein MSAN_01207700 [Mycena sanguinolenta]
MHPALEIFEIQERIFRHFYRHGYATFDLVALACTCKTFQEHALDLIWHWDCSLRRFFNLFPQDALVRGEKGTWSRVVRPLRPLVKADFERFSFYANRVRGFAFGDYPISHLDEIFEAMAPHLPEGCLFPNLRSFNSMRGDASEIRFFVSKKLIRISMQYRKPCAGLAFISPVAPILERFSISSPWHRSVDEDTSVVSVLLQQMREIRHLYTRTLSWDALVHLSNVVFLRHFTVGELAFAGLPMTRLGPFISLEHLDFQGAPTSHLFHFLRLSTHLAVKVFHIGIQDDIAAGSGRIHDMLCDHLDHTSVSDIRITIASFLPAERIQTTSSSALLRLHVFSNLISLELHADRKIALTEEVLETLTRAWPRLQVLRLITQNEPDTPENQTKLPLKALQHFTKHCQHLRTLELMFDTTNPPSTPEDDAVQTTLTELRVSFSPIMDLDKASVAGYLFHLFPNIMTMFYKLNFVVHILADPNDGQRTRIRRHSPEEAGWNGVAGYLQDLHKVKIG